MSEWDKKILKIFSCIFLHYRVASNQFYFQIEMPEIKPSGHAYGSKLISGEGRGRRGGGGGISLSLLSKTVVCSVSSYLQRREETLQFQV